MISFKVQITTIFILLAVSGHSQEKLTIGVMSMTFPETSVTQEMADAIENKVVEAFVITHRFNMVDRSKMNDLRAEKELQKTEDFIDGEVVQQGASLGAAYLVSGHINSALTKRVKFANKEIYGYEVELSISLQLIEVATSQVLTTTTIKPQSSTLFGSPSPSKQEAFQKALNGVRKQIDQFVAKNFPMTVQIIEFKGEDDILINAGSELGVQKRDRYSIVEVTTVEVNGEVLERTSELGQMQVTDVEGENFSVCKLKKGKDDVLLRFKEGAVLKCISMN